MNLYGSANTESLIKTKKIIASFKYDKENCGKFIYFWWYMWAPMSERGFVENAYMTPAEAYVCSKIGNAIYTKIAEEQEAVIRKQAEEAAIRRQAEEIAKVKADSIIYSRWIEEGVPSSTMPPKNAQLTISGSDNLAKYISEIRTQELFKKSIRVTICADGQIKTPTDESDARLLELLNVRVVSPACYDFKYIKKSIPMESSQYIEIYEKREPALTKAESGQYKAGVKYDKSNSKWVVKISKDNLDEFINNTGVKSQEYLEALSNAIGSLPTKPKKYIKFHFLDSTLYLGSPYKKITLSPIAIIDEY